MQKNLGEIIDLYRGILLDLNKQYPPETSREGIKGTLQKGARLRGCPKSQITQVLACEPKY